MKETTKTTIENIGGVAALAAIHFGILFLFHTFSRTYRLLTAWQNLWTKPVLSKNTACSHSFVRAGNNSNYIVPHLTMAARQAAETLHSQGRGKPRILGWGIPRSAYQTQRY